MHSLDLILYTRYLILFILRLRVRLWTQRVCICKCTYLCMYVQIYAYTYTYQTSFLLFVCTSASPCAQGKMLQERPTKVTYTHPKRPTKETYSLLLFVCTSCAKGVYIYTCTDMYVHIDIFMYVHILFWLTRLPRPWNKVPMDMYMYTYIWAYRHIHRCIRWYSPFATDAVRNLYRMLQERPTKETYIHQKRPTKETYSFLLYRFLI